MKDAPYRLQICLQKSEAMKAMFSLHLDSICLPPPSMRNIFLQKEVLVLQKTCSDFAPSQCVRAFKLVVSTCCLFTESADIAGIHRKPFL